jgi:hypothetical protein
MKWIKSIRSFYRKSRLTLLYIDRVFVLILFYAGQVGNYPDPGVGNCDDPNPLQTGELT